MLTAMIALLGLWPCFHSYYQVSSFSLHRPRLTSPSGHSSSCVCTRGADCRRLATIRRSPSVSSSSSSLQALPSPLLLSDLVSSVKSIHIPVNVLLSLASVAGVVAFHEAGHFLAARWQGMKIDSYNIGRLLLLSVLCDLHHPPLPLPFIHSLLSHPPALYPAGYGPKVLSFNDSTNTEFALRLVPLGGYVAFPTNVG